MRRLILILASILLCWSADAQELTKEQRKEIREQKKIAAARKQQIKDSLFLVERHKKDSILRDKIIKESATDIIATTSLSMTQAFDYIAKALIAADYVISVDKEYGTITTQRISCGHATYSLYFRFSEKENGSEVKACGFAYGTVGIAMYGIVSANEHTFKVENSKTKGSVFYNVFTTYEKILLSLPDAQLKYKRIVK